MDQTTPMTKPESNSLVGAFFLYFRPKSLKRLSKVPREKTIVDYVEDVKRWKSDTEVETKRNYYYYSLKRGTNGEELSTLQMWKGDLNEQSLIHREYKGICYSSQVLEEKLIDSDHRKSFKSTCRALTEIPTQIEVIMKPRDKLAHLLSSHCRHQTFQNELLLWMYKDREILVIRQIESLLEEDLPCDELSFTISTFAKNALSAIGQEPYDENIGRFTPENIHLTG